MKITTENNVKNFILDRIKNVYIGFDDNIEVKLDAIIDFDIDLSDGDNSTIELTNVFEHIEILNHFKTAKSTRIIYVHIEATGVRIVNGVGHVVTNVYYDIPCDMKISRLRIEGNKHEAGNMLVELEGLVK